jgi:hypothetical protein
MTTFWLPAVVGLGGGSEELLPPPPPHPDNRKARKAKTTSRRIMSSIFSESSPVRHEPLVIDPTRLRASVMQLHLAAGVRSNDSSSDRIAPIETCQ